MMEEDERKDGRMKMKMIKKMNWKITYRSSRKTPTHE